MVTVLKIQLPLSAPEGSPALAYNEDRSVQFTFPVDEELIAFANGREKFYVEAEIKKNDESGVTFVPIRETEPW